MCTLCEGMHVHTHASMHVYTQVHLDTLSNPVPTLSQPPRWLSGSQHLWWGKPVPEIQLLLSLYIPCRQSSLGSLSSPPAHFSPLHPVNTQAENPVCHVIALSFYAWQWGLCRWTLPSWRRTSMPRPLTFLFLKTIYSTRHQTVFFLLLRGIPKKTQPFTPARSLLTSTRCVMELGKYRFLSSLWLREDGIGFSSPLQPSSLVINVTIIQI